MTILIGADHRGYELKDELKFHLLKDFQIEIMDVGTYDKGSIDYPLIAQSLCHKLLDENNKINRGILICGSGHGMCMSANRNKDIRAAVCRKKEEVIMARKHGDINVLCLGSDHHQSFFRGTKLIEIIQKFLHTNFEGGRHAKRIEMIEILKGSG